jgi:hypothetical protein
MPISWPSGVVPLRASDLSVGDDLLIHSKRRASPTLKRIRKISRSDVAVRVWYDGAPLAGDPLPPRAEVMARKI